MLDVTAFEAVLNVLLGGMYWIGAILAWYGAGLARDGRSYWPAMRLLFVTFGTRFLFLALADAPWWDEQTSLAFQHVLPKAVITLFNVVMMGCACWLVTQQELARRRHGSMARVGMDGKTTLPTVREAQAQVVTVARDAQRAIVDGGGTPPVPSEAKP